MEFIAGKHRAHAHCIANPSSLLLIPLTGSKALHLVEEAIILEVRIVFVPLPMLVHKTPSHDDTEDNHNERTQGSSRCRTSKRKGPQYNRQRSEEMDNEQEKRNNET